jgi:hypothetical protein
MVIAASAILAGLARPACFFADVDEAQFAAELGLAGDVHEQRCFLRAGDEDVRFDGQRMLEPVDLLAAKLRRAGSDLHAGGRFNGLPVERAGALTIACQDANALFRLCSRHIAALLPAAAHPVGQWVVAARL